MCRLAAYLGPPIRLDRFLLDPPHSLYRQSWACREMREAVVNADGYGIGFLDETHTPLTYKSSLPIWGDANLSALGTMLRSPLWVGNVRSATPGQGTGLHNTQPYAGAGLLFLHNGYLENFETHVKIEFHRRLPPETAACIQGSSDSEYLYAWLRAHMEDPGPPAQALQKCLAALTTTLGLSKALLSIVVAHREELLVCRHALNAPCPSLYYCTEHEYYPNAVLVASERLDANAAWQAVPEHHLLRLAPGRAPLEIAL